VSKCTCPFDCSACEEFSKTKGIRSIHKQDCSWYNDNTTCSCFLFSPFGVYVPYTPLQVSNIFKKEDEEQQ
jgi:hypothetical protein